MAAALYACPRCGYDQAGQVATWTLACPLETRCPECGSLFFTSHAFARPELGPRWSFEHASRRLLCRWVATTVMTFFPARVWNGLKAEQPIVPRRRAILAVTWLVMLHLVCGLCVLGSQVAMSLVGGWSMFDGWSAGDPRSWVVVLGLVGWPYNRNVELPINATMSHGSPMIEFIAIATAPGLVLAICVGIWSRRFRSPGRGHFVRALVLWIPQTAFWIGASVLAFAIVGRLETPTSPSHLTPVIMLSLIGAYAASMIWWWRCYAVFYTDSKRGSYVIVVMGLLSLPAGWILAAVTLAACGW